MTTQETTVALARMMMMMMMHICLDHRYLNLTHSHVSAKGEHNIYQCYKSIIKGSKNSEHES